MTLLIIDGNNMAFRARYSFELSHRGKDVSVTYGFLRMLLAVVKEVKPEAVLACFDGGYPGFRKRLVPTYKQHRKHEGDLTYPEFVRQMDELLEILPWFGVMTARRRGIEADDLMFQATRMSLHRYSMVYTNDDDLLQAINDNTGVLKPTKLQNELITPSNFYKYKHVKPGCFMAAKVLLGDVGDGVPGCFGVGEKTVAKLFFGMDCVPDALPDLRTRMTELMARRVEAYWGMPEFQNAWAVMDLALDRAGARYALINTPWQPYNDKHVQRYCINNAFMSLVEASPLLSVFGPLRQPKLAVPDGMRIPRVWDYARTPVELFMTQENPSS